MTELVYVTTDDRRFCEHGREVLDALGVERREISDSSEEAQELAAAGIPLGFMPVLTDGHRVIASGRLSEKHLRMELGSDGGPRCLDDETTPVSAGGVGTPASAEPRARPLPQTIAFASRRRSLRPDLRPY